MKMAKANEADLDAAMKLCSALEALTNRWTPLVPEAIDQGGGEENERFDIDNTEQCRRVLEYLRNLAERASLFRVVFGMAVLLDPRNKCVDPDADTLEHHPDVQAAEAAKTARPASDYNDDMGEVLWWKFPVDEPPYCGDPKCVDWPGYHTHWTPLLVPAAPSPQTPASIPEGA